MYPNNTSPTAGVKRAYQAGDAPSSQPFPESVQPGSPPLTSASATSAFRNVSACNRCRVRKNRCDQHLPACSTCEKANVRCVGYDPITKRELPRSYVYFLESRLAYFESLLKENNIRFDASEVYNADSREVGDSAASPESVKHSWRAPSQSSSAPVSREQPGLKREEDRDRIDKLVSNIGMVSVQGASDARYLGSTSGISFARVVLAAVKSSVSTNNSERTGPKPSKPIAHAAATGGSSMRDSYFGLQTKPTINEAAFPDRHLGEKLVHLYFEYANPQIPILHRGEFMDIVDRAYTTDPSRRTSRELYLLNIVFAIGAGIIWGSSDPGPDASQGEYIVKRPRLTNQQAQPEEYHASAIVNLGSFLSSHSSTDGSDRAGGDLEELEAVLLLAAFALLRPVAPGLWYIVGVAMRLAVDLGLHYEDGTGIDDVSNGVTVPSAQTSSFRSIDGREKGRREWVRDLRRRLWWCTYNFDRLVSTCVGRPFGITDQVVTTEFPSLLDDKYISRSGFVQHQGLGNEPSYKRIAHHYLRLRLLQSEILQVLQYQQAQQARSTGTNRQNDFMHTDIKSPFLSKFDSFRAWRKHIDQRLYDWRISAPTQGETGVSFDPKFLELNYWQAVTTLYRQSLSIPRPLAGERSPTEDVASPSSTIPEEREDEDQVFLKCAEAGQQTLKLYRQLHRQRLVNYTYLATHHLFMAGISFLYAVWHSPRVRSRLTLDDFDFTVLAATSVLGDLMEKCPPAESCRDAFERMSKATVQMCLSTPGSGFADEPPPPIVKRESSYAEPVLLDPQLKHDYQPIAPKLKKAKRPAPQFDMDLRGLFPDDLDVTARPSNSFPLNFQRKQQQAQKLPPLFPQSSSHDTVATQSSPMSIGSQIHSGLGMAQTILPSISPTQQQHPSSQHFVQNTYNPDFMDLSSMPGMDFLNMTNSAPSTISGSAAQASSNDDFNYGVSPGLDLGFGVGTAGFDFSHDWSDGQQFDLFDGFFFGNGNGT